MVDGTPTDVDEGLELERERKRLASRSYFRGLRKKVIEILGDQCVRCGFSDERALQIDHVNGGGTQDKKSISGVYYKAVLLSVEAKEDKYQLLCANCNWIKRFENKEVAGRKD